MNNLLLKKHKHKVAKISIVVILALIILFTSWYFISKFYDEHKVVFQQPVSVAVRPPILIVKRLIYRDPPKAEFIDVNPLTTPQEIMDNIKNHKSFEYAQPVSLATISRDTIKALIKNKVMQKWGEASWKDIDYILTNESNYDPYIVNKESGACGLFQALPCTKLPSLDITDQINWGIDYIEKRYNGADKAVTFWKANKWY